MNADIRPCTLAGDPWEPYDGISGERHWRQRSAHWSPMAPMGAYGRQAGVNGRRTGAHCSPNVPMDDNLITRKTHGRHFNLTVDRSVFSSHQWGCVDTHRVQTITNGRP